MPDLKITPIISGATPIFMSVSRPCARSQRTAKARSGSMRCGIARSPRAGRPNACTLSIATLASPDRAPSLVTASKNSSAKSRSPRPASSWALKFPGWPATRPIGIGLIELCALTATLILDEDGIYDPASFNDRLLLGLKGTMSEAELHILKARMRGGQLNKARRGELEIGPPVGLMYRPDGILDLDPDVEVQDALRLVFDTFERLGSATRTVKFFLDQGILFPRRLRKEPNKGELLWAPPRHSRILQVLHNPRYAGAFVYGRTRGRHRPGGGVSQIKVPMDDWQFVFPDHHRGYIDWERFKANQARLADNAQAYGMQRRSGPVREGTALLQGRVLCGLCGERMGVHYSQEHGQPVPTYVCQETAARKGGKVCQSVPGKVVDPAIGALLVELMTPMTLEVSLAVQNEIEARAAETDALRRQHIERTRYEAELARRRYMKVDPDNRLVADALEAEWNEKLRLHTDAVEDYERRAQQEAAALDGKMRRHILELAEQFPRIWADPRVDMRERKRILRLLVADVTLIKADDDYRPCAPVGRRHAHPAARPASTHRPDPQVQAGAGRRSRPASR